MNITIKASAARVPLGAIDLRTPHAVRLLKRHGIAESGSSAQQKSTFNSAL